MCNCKYRKITEYTTVARYDNEDFIREVNERIKQGWQPLGNIVAKGNGCMYQKLVKYEEAEIKKPGF